MKAIKNHFCIILFILLALSSCKAPQVVTETVVKDSVIVREIPRIIEVHGAVVESPSINLDSLVQLIQAGVKSETISNTLIRTDPETNLRVGLLIDELGNLSALCEQQEHTISFLEREVERWRYESEKNTVIEKPSFWDRVQGGMVMVVVVFLIALAGFTIFRR